jgi:hypothetical protein
MKIPVSYEDEWDDNIDYKNFLSHLCPEHQKIMEYVGMGYNGQEIAGFIGCLPSTMSLEVVEIRRLWGLWNRPRPL